MPEILELLMSAITQRPSKEAIQALLRKLLPPAGGTFSFLTAAALATAFLDAAATLAAAEDTLFAAPAFPFPVAPFLTIVVPTLVLLASLLLPSLACSGFLAASWGLLALRVGPPFGGKAGSAFTGLMDRGTGPRAAVVGLTGDRGIALAL